MRQRLVGAGLIALAAALSGCADTPDEAGFRWPFARVDPVEAAERAVVGAALGAGMGTAIGTAFSINPGIGSIVGAEAGAAIGAAIGAATAQPLPDYKPLAPPVTAMIPDFYDTWPPGYRPPPVAAQTPPPPPPG